MMEGYKYVLEAQAELPNGELVKGPITTSNDKTYVFVNKHSTLDVYLKLEKDQNIWRQSAGHEIQYSQEMVSELGSYIDKFLIENPILSKATLS